MYSNIKELKKRILAFTSALIIPITAGCTPNNSNSADDYSEYISSFTSLEAKYNYLEQYLSDAEILDIVSKASNFKRCSSTDTNYENLAEIIIFNSIHTLDEDRVIFFDASNPSASKITQEQDHILRDALETALKNIFKTSSNIAEDICHLKELKILKVRDESIPYYYDYIMNEITINYDMLKRNHNTYQKDGTIKNLSLTDYITVYLEKCLNGVREYACSCRTDALQPYTSITSYCTFKNVMLSTRETANYMANLGANPILYDYIPEIKEQALMQLMALCANKENIIEVYYASIFDSNLPAFYRYFDLENSEFISFYRIGYTMDAIRGRNDLSTYLSNTLDINTPKKIEEVLGDGYKFDIYKKAVKELMEYVINNNDLSLENCLFLYDFIYSYTYSTKNNAELFNKAEDIFYDFLMSFYHVSMSDIMSCNSVLPEYYESLDASILTGEATGKISYLLNNFHLLGTIRVLNGDVNAENALKLVRELDS